MARRPNVAVQDLATDTIDEHQEGGQDYRSGEVQDDAEDFLQGLAREVGWKPQEEWDRDPSKWTDHRTFLKQTPREIETLKERLKRTGQAAADAIEDARRQARIEAQAEIRAAAEAKDPEAAERAAQKLAENSGPPPQTQAWIARNSWFDADPEARAVAVARVNRLAQQGASIEEQLEAAESEVRKRFPEHFGMREQPREEVRLSETRRAPPMVATGNRGGSTTPKEKGFADIPAGDRALYARHFQKRFESQGLKTEDAQARWAKSYWSNKGEE